MAKKPEDEKPEDEKPEEKLEEKLEEKKPEEEKEYTGGIPEYLNIGESDGIHLRSRREVQLNHSLANKMLSMTAAPGDRPLRDAGVAKLIVAMKRGTFLYELVDLIVAICLENGIEYRGNGQHTSWATLELPDDFPHLKVTVLTYECRTLDDVRRLYASIDRGISRTKSNVVSSYLGDTEQFKGVPVRMASWVVSGLAMWLWEETHARSQHDGDEIAYLIQGKHAAVVNRVLAFVNVAGGFTKCKHLDRSSVASAMLETFSAAPVKAQEFWLAVRDGANLDNTDPRLVLFKFLMTIRLMSSSNARTAKTNRSVGAEEAYRCCIHAWNAWRKGDTMTTLRGPTHTTRPRAK